MRFIIASLGKGSTKISEQPFAVTSSLNHNFDLNLDDEQDIGIGINLMMNMRFRLGLF